MKHSLKREAFRQLRDTFGLADYRPGQKEAVHALLSGRDVMCILPTGAGKSLCWQLPALVHQGLTVVISPLIALMRDQVQHLHALGIPATSLDSLQSPEERTQALSDLRDGRVRIVLVSPERLMQRQFRQLCEDVPPWLVVVDEAHCVLQWGEEFRPAYAAIADFLGALPKRPVLCAMTATADGAMQRAISASLCMRRTKRILLPHIRDNLVYEVRTTLDRAGNILRLCRESPCKTVIFCGTRAGAEALAAMLRSHGIAAEHYHAGLERTVRLSAQERFQTGETAVLCATSAFGMGIDIPDVRRVIHAHLPDDVIDYVQQSGRAGRDGQRAECILLFEPNDLLKKNRLHARPTKWSLQGWLRLRRDRRKQARLLRTLLTSPCIPAGLAAALGRRIPPCGQCSACQKGRLLTRIPRLDGLGESRVRLWFLCWQRDVMAKQRGCLPGQIMPDAALRSASRRLVFPDGADVPPEIERLLRHLRGE